MLTKAWTQLRYHATQQRLWTCPDRFVACRAGRRSGKTTLAKRRLVRYLPVKLWHNMPGRYLYCAPTRDQAKRIAWQDLKDLCNPDWVSKINETELIITSVWGSEIHVSGFDKPQRLEGVGWDGIVCDESADIKPKSVDKSLLPALADRKGWLWRIGVPKRTGVGAIEFKRICEDRTKGYTFFGWSAEEILDTEELTSLKERLDEKDYDEQIKGIAVEAGGLAFHQFSVAESIEASTRTQYNPDLRIVVGSDFNVDPMAWVLCHVQDNKIFVFDEIWLRGTNTVRTLDELYSRYPDQTERGGWLFMGDAAGRARKTAATAATPSDYLIIKHDARFTAQRDLAGTQVRYPRSNPAVKDRLASCNAMLKSASGIRRLFVSPVCTHLVDDLLSRALDERGQPEDATADAGHITDALGYIVHGLFPVYFASQLEQEESGDYQMSGGVELTVFG